MADFRPDLLAGLSLAARRRREQADAELIRTTNVIRQRVGSREAVDRDFMLAGVPGLRASTAGIRPLAPGESVDFVIAARVDLDHPIYFADNLFGDCADCGTALQWRPHAPPGPRICVCCAARRVREDPDYRGGDG